MDNPSCCYSNATVIVDFKDGWFYLKNTDCSTLNRMLFKLWYISMRLKLWIRKDPGELHRSSLQLTYLWGIYIIRRVLHWVISSSVYFAHCWLLKNLDYNLFYNLQDLQFWNRKASQLLGYKNVSKAQWFTYVQTI